MLKLAVLISGRGSNMEALAHACKEPGFPARIAVVISNRSDAKGIETAEDMGIAARVIDHKTFSTREAFDEAVENELKAQDVDLVCLAGFMRIFSESFATRWTGRIINIHPSLLPLFPGTHVHQQALDAGVRVSGSTVHWVIPELDAGPTIGQSVVPVIPGDTADTLAARVLPGEHALYAHCVRLIAEGKARYEDGKTVFSDVDATTAFSGPDPL